MTSIRVSQQILTATATLLMTACGYYNQAEHNPGPGSQAPFRQGETLGFETVKTVMGRNRCFDCHSVEKGNRGGVNLETYANAKALAGRIAATTASGFMPMGGPQVGAGDVAVLQAWADAGAPQTSDLPVPGGATPAPAHVPVPTPVSVALDFARVKASIFSPHCVGCHSSFANYASVAGRLMDIQRAVDTNLMPKNGPALSADLKTMLADWIAAGAPENMDGDDDDDNDDGFNASN